MTKWLSAFLFIFIAGFCNGQYSDTTNYLFRYTSTGSINQTDESTAYLLNNAFGFGMRKETISLNFNNTWIYGKHNETWEDKCRILFQ